jgi:stearoyl-CoA desaturase (delta-9 desaturase)
MDHSLSSKAAPRFNRVNFLFLTGTPLLALIVVPWYLHYHDMTLAEFVVLFFFFISAGLGITMGYHRFFSHKTYEDKYIVKLGGEYR